MNAFMLGFLGVFGLDGWWHRRGCAMCARAHQSLRRGDLVVERWRREMGTPREPGTIRWP